MAGLDFSKLTPDNGAVRDLKQLIFLVVSGADKLGTMFNFLPGQKNGSKVGFIGEFGMIGTKSGGCNPNYKQSVLAASEKAWDIQEWEVAEEICYKDLEGTLAQIAMRTKTDIADLTGTEYIDDIISPRLELAIMKMLMRLAWFGDKNAKNISEGGILSEGVSKEFFTITDGFWKRFFSLVASNPERRTAIAANEESTFQGQKSKLFEPGVATGIIDNLITDSPMILRQVDNATIYITQSLKDALDRDIKTQNKGSELQWKSLFLGIKETEYNGYRTLAIPFWDEVIQSCEKGDVAWNKPHRALFTTPTGLLVGSESEDELTLIDIWFDKNSQMNRILAKDKLGTLIAQDDLLQVAY